MGWGHTVDGTRSFKLGLALFFRLGGAVNVFVTLDLVVMIAFDGKGGVSPRESRYYSRLLVLLQELSFDALWKHVSAALLCSEASRSHGFTCGGVQSGNVCHVQCREALIHLRAGRGMTMCLLHSLLTSDRLNCQCDKVRHAMHSQ